ncbi:MAG: lysoplasmalogenase family protein [Candidatus Hodarchaeales archaeon]
MFESIYFPVLVIFGVFWIVLKGIREGEFKIFEEQAKLLPDTLVTGLKAMPALLVTLFVVANPLDNVVFHFLLIGAFVFCLLGDIGMEKGLLTGLPLFLVAQLLFILSFTSSVLVFGLVTNAFFLTILTLIGTAVYVYVLLYYLDSSEKGLGSFKKPVIVYACCLGLMFTSSVFLWLTVSKVELLVVVLGALLFVLSDSMIAVREFHHRFSMAYTLVMSTYYSAIFLLSLVVLVL